MIIKEFGKANYESVIYVDFRSNSMIHSAFDGDFDINLMIMVITANNPKVSLQNINNFRWNTAWNMF